MIRPPERRKTNHVGHFLLTLITGGFWLIPWILFTILNRNHNARIDMAMWQASQSPHARHDEKACTCAHCRCSRG